MSEVRQYEVIYIITPEATDEVVKADLHKQVEAVVQRFGGLIEKLRTGTALSRIRDRPPPRGDVFTRSVERPWRDGPRFRSRPKVTDQVIRHLAVRVDEELRVAERAKAKRQAESRRRRAARGLPPLAEGEEARP